MANRQLFRIDAESEKRQKEEIAKGSPIPAENAKRK